MVVGIIFGGMLVVIVGSVWLPVKVVVNKKRMAPTTGGTRVSNQSGTCCRHLPHSSHSTMCTPLSTGAVGGTIRWSNEEEK